MAVVMFLVGLLLVALAIGALAGVWWGLLAAGLILVALGVLTQAGTGPTAARRDGER